VRREGDEWCIERVSTEARTPVPVWGFEMQHGYDGECMRDTLMEYLLDADGFARHSSVRVGYKWRVDCMDSLLNTLGVHGRHTIHCRSGDIGN
jgi:hypothetical protein